MAGVAQWALARINLQGLTAVWGALQEEEAETFWAPEHMLLEEERLRKEREEQAAAAVSICSLAVSADML